MDFALLRMQEDRMDGDERLECFYMQVREGGRLLGEAQLVSHGQRLDRLRLKRPEAPSTGTSSLEAAAD